MSKKKPRKLKYLDVEDDYVEEMIVKRLKEIRDLLKEIREILKSME